MHIAVYGANGFQAKLVLAELTRRAITPVLVGRNRARLEHAAEAVGLASAELREADIADHDSLVAAFSGCEVMINCAGPFTVSGEPVVRAAIAAGVHYVDTSGEQAQIKSTFDRFGADAERQGVSVVPAAHDACVPGDLVAHLLGERLAPLESITVSHIITGGGGLSRGSLRSAMVTFDALTSGGLVYQSGAWVPAAGPAERKIVFPGEPEPTLMAKLPLAEVITIPRHVAVERVESFVEAAVSAQLGTPIPAEFIDALPEGPSEEGRRSQRFTYLIEATAADGSTGRATVSGTDTYGITAVIAVEAAARLAVDGAAPGVLAPAQAFDPARFLTALASHGLQWGIDAP